MAKENAPHIKGYPTDIEGKMAYCASFYHRELKHHFELESKLWQQVSSKSNELRDIINELTKERELLIDLFKELESKTESKILFQLGALLEQHVRKEERVLFQQIQKDLSEEELLALEI